jgi:hypothetical protein
MFSAKSLWLQFLINDFREMCRKYDYYICRWPDAGTGASDLTFKKALKGRKSGPNILR